MSQTQKIRSWKLSPQVGFTLPILMSGASIRSNDIGPIKVLEAAPLLERLKEILYEDSRDQDIIFLFEDLIKELENDCLES